MKSCCIFIGMMSLMVSSLRGQTDSIVGAYNGSKPELACQLYLTPEHEFALSMSYGSADNLILGTWEAQGKKIVFKPKKPTDDGCFLVYEGKGAGQDLKFTFNDFGQNTTTAFRILDKYMPDSMQYIYLPGESSFSHTNILEASGKGPRTFFLSRRIGQDKQEVYTFKLSEGCNEVFLYYQENAINTSIDMKAEIVGGKLYTIDEAGNKNLFGYRKDLPENYKAQMEEAKNSLAAPDTLGKESTGMEGVLRRINCSKRFEIAAPVKSDKAYFQSADDSIGLPPYAKP